MIAFSAGAAAALLGVVAVAAGAREAELRVPAGGAIARYGRGALITAAGLYVAYLQLGWLVGYPLGVPTVTLRFLSPPLERAVTALRGAAAGTPDRQSSHTTQGGYGNTEWEIGEMGQIALHRR